MKYTMQSISRESARAAENLACRCLVHSASSSRVRAAVAAAIRAWRSLGDKDRAQWFHRHAYFIGNPVLLRAAR